jgi:hypothetical protein
MDAAKSAIPVMAKSAMAVWAPRGCGPPGRFCFHAAEAVPVGAPFNPFRHHQHCHRRIGRPSPPPPLHPERGWGSLVAVTGRTRRRQYKRPKTPPGGRFSPGRGDGFPPSGSANIGQILVKYWSNFLPSGFACRLVATRSRATPPRRCSRPGHQQAAVRRGLNGIRRLRRQSGVNPRVWGRKRTHRHAPSAAPLRKSALPPHGSASRRQGRPFRRLSPAHSRGSSKRQAFTPALHLLYK